MDIENVGVWIHFYLCSALLGQVVRQGTERFGTSSSNLNIWRKRIWKLLNQDKVKKNEKLKFRNLYYSLWSFCFIIYAEEQIIVMKISKKHISSRQASNNSGFEF